jgi:hypothetical protein
MPLLTAHSPPSFPSRHSLSAPALLPAGAGGHGCCCSWAAHPAPALCRQLRLPAKHGAVHPQVGGWVLGDACLGVFTGRDVWEVGVRFSWWGATFDVEPHCLLHICTAASLRSASCFALHQNIKNSCSPTTISPSLCGRTGKVLQKSNACTLGCMCDLAPFPARSCAPATTGTGGSRPLGWGWGRSHADIPHSTNQPPAYLLIQSSPTLLAYCLLPFTTPATALLSPALGPAAASLAGVQGGAHWAARQRRPRLFLLHPRDGQDGASCHRPPAAALPGALRFCCSLAVHARPSQPAAFSLQTP